MASITPSETAAARRLAQPDVSAPSSSGPYAILGSQNVAFAALASGGQLVAWLEPNSSVLHTAIRNSSGAAVTTGATYPVGPNGQQVIAADFNGDGIEDLAVSNFGSLDSNMGGSVQIFIGKGDGTFAAPVSINTVATPVAMHSADFNGDGKQDLAVADVNDDIIYVLLGNGDGTFQDPVAYPVTGSPQSLVAVDLNGDGKLDIASVNLFGGASVLLGNGDGSFKSEAKYPLGTNSATFVAAADLNGDGKPDLLVASGMTNEFLILFGNGDGSFQSPLNYAVGASGNDFGLALATDGALLLTLDTLGGTEIATPITSRGVVGTPQLYTVPKQVTGIAAGDLNGDKYADMVAADGGITVLLRNPSGAFAAPVNYPLQSGSQAAAVALGDFNGDGKLDVVASSMSTDSNGNIHGTVDVALGKGDGTLGAQNSYGMGGYPGGLFGASASGIVVGDFNGDGKLDVAAGFQTTPGGANSGGVTVLLGNGDGTLRTGVNYGTSSSSVFSLVAGDFNGDGKLDLIAGTGTDNFTGGALMILLGKGDGTFQAPAMTPVGTGGGTPNALAAADLNGDGHLDLVAAVWSTSGTGMIVVLLGNGDGTFRQLPAFQASAAGSALAIADLNGDGVPDLVIGDCCGLSESQYALGKGDGTFGTPQFFVSGSSVSAFATANWNNDGVAGLAIAQENNTVMALESGLNPKFAGPGGSTPAAARVQSAAGGVTLLAPGSLASAFGSDLATATPTPPALPWPNNLAGTTVSIADSAGARTAALLTYASPGQVNFQIPDSVATGPATVTVTSGDGTASTAQVTLSAYAPALFTLNSANLAAAVAICVSASGAQTVEYPYQVVSGALVAQPLNLGACSETVLELYATGMDLATVQNVQVTMGGATAQVLGAQPQGTWPGLDQINVAIPQSLAGKGNVAILVTAGGVAANSINVTIQ
jgi:uncharacterized protein (TIGR03437 family)